MSTSFGRLLTAKTDTELFILLCNLTHASQQIGARVKGWLECGQVGDQALLKLTVEQAMEYVVTPALAAQYHNVLPLGSRLARWEKIHEFTLPDDGPLTWKIRDQVVATGYLEVQCWLERLHDTADSPLSIQG